MRIAATLVCVDYAQPLSRSLAAWRDGLDQLVVVTTPGDAATLDLCRREGVHAHRSLAIDRDGAVFNKAAMLEEGLAAVAPTDWVLLLDADVEPRAGWRPAVERMVAERGGAGRLYGATRVEEDGSPIADDPCAGYFMLWHAADPAARERPLLGSWRSAAGYDTALAARWHPSHREVLPLGLVHRGPRGRNWCGVGRGGAMAALRADRLRAGGWAHERLDGPRGASAPGVGVGPGGAADAPQADGCAVGGPSVAAASILPGRGAVGAPAGLSGGGA